MSVRRCGFLSRSFLGLGGLIVSRGFGPCAVADDEVVVDEQQQDGTGRHTRVSVQRTKPPKASIRFTGKKKGD